MNIIGCSVTGNTSISTFSAIFGLPVLNNTGSHPHLHLDIKARGVNLQTSPLPHHMEYGTCRRRYSQSICRESTESTRWWHVPCEIDRTYTYSRSLYYHVRWTDRTNTLPPTVRWTDRTYKHYLYRRRWSEVPSVDRAWRSTKCPDENAFESPNLLLATSNCDLCRVAALSQQSWHAQ